MDERHTRVLVIDAEPRILRLVHVNLERAGYVVLTARTDEPGHHPVAPKPAGSQSSHLA